MPGQRVASLEIELALATGGAVSDVTRFGGVVDKVSAQAIRDLDQIDAAMKGVGGLHAPTAQVVQLAEETARSAISMVRDRNRIEKSGEAMVRQLDREAAALGRTRDEMRAAKVEALALAAAQGGNTDLADRLLGAARKRDQAATAAAQDRDAALADEARRALEARVAAEAAVNAKLMERARLEEALGRTDGTSRPRATDNGATFSALAARAADEEARATTAAAASAERLSREHAELVAKVRGSQAAMEADAAAAERLRMSTDPLYAATKRLNDEIAESTRLYNAGATAPAEYARQQDVLVGRLRDVTQQHDMVTRGLGQAGTSGKLAGHHMQNLAFQFQDLGVQMAAAAGSSAPFKMAMMALFQQGTQIQGIMSQAGIGIRGVGAAFGQMSKAILVATVTNPILLGIAAAIGLVAGGIALLNKSANEGADMKKYAASLGLTAKEIRGLDNVTVTYGDTAKAVFQVAGAAIWSGIGPAISSVWDQMKSWLEWIGSGVKTYANFMIGSFIGAYHLIGKAWQQFSAVMSEAFTGAVNAAVDAINALVRKSVDGLNGFIRSANTILGTMGLKLPELSAPEIAKLDQQHRGAAEKWRNTVETEMKKARGVDYVGTIGGAIVDQAQKNARDRIKKQAEEKGYLDPEKPDKPKTDKHAEQLARENEAIEAQIRNLYALADAYGDSGAAALIAEARVKAESDAIKKRGDIEMFVDRQVRLTIAQRVSDAAKSTAGVREQANAQEAINAKVAAGLIPAERAADLMKDQIADLPLLAALQAAQQRGLAVEAARATSELANQRAERERLRKAEETTQFNRDMASGTNRLAELAEEARLIGATDAVRAHALATLRATQEAESKFTDPAQRSAYVAQQVQIADLAAKLVSDQDAYNASLTFTAEKWDIIAGKIQSAGQGMADAFGSAGRAIGDVASIFAGYHASRERALAEHNAAITKAGASEKQLAQENARFALRSSGAQIEAYGDMASAAKGFFKEGSSGYNALAAAEKAFRIVQFAMSVQAMIQNAAETIGFVTGSTARTTAAATEGIATQSKLVFPYNIIAMAATGAALVAAGISVFGGGGGGASATPVTNTGAGTVLGDRSAQSESITRSIDALREVDIVMLGHSRDMAASLRSIDSQIGGFASLLVRAGNIDAGAVEKKAGGILGSLFGSSTSITGSGLFGGPQSLGSILSGGFDASYYSDVQKKSKFLGITTGTKTSTQYAGADAGLENQFTLILREFTRGIAAAGGPLGVATKDIEDRLASFVFTLGKVDLKDLSGEEIAERLNAVLGAAADQMAGAVFPGFDRFQKVGEGLFETIVRVSSSVEAVTDTLMRMGGRIVDIDAQMALVGQFDSLSDLTSAADAYFQTYYTQAERNAAQLQRFGVVFSGLGLSLPTSIAGFRALVDAQDLASAAGQATWATLIQLAPAFADLQSAMEGGKSATDVMAERADLERKLLELRGDTAAIRALDLAKLDASNRGLQEQVWAVQDAQEAARAAEDLRKAWTSVGDSIMTEVQRIRGLTGVAGGGGFATLQGRFNAATSSARGGDQDAAKLLPGLSQELLRAAADAATSRQELDRIQAQTAASLEATYGAISALGMAATAGPSTSDLLAAITASQGTSQATNDNTDLRTAFDGLRAEVAQMRADNNEGLAAIAGSTGKIARTMEDVTSASGGDAIATVRRAS